MPPGGHDIGSGMRSEPVVGPLAIRVAGNETTARMINEAIEEGRVTGSGRIGFVCECARLGCSDVLELRLAEYEHVRSASRQFLVAAGHEEASDLLVGEVAGRYRIVAKSGTAAEHAATTDPRADGLAVQLVWSRGRRLSLINLDVEANEPSVGRTRGWLVGFAAEHGADHDCQGRVALAVTEAMSNAVRHAYRPDDHGRIEVSADVEDGELEIVVADEGTGIRPSASDGLGAGLSLIAQTAERFAIRERRRRGVEVWMRFRLPSADTPPPAVAG
jgi:anti-sigma regulatory factor (Ser/Thr protein kinase)